MKRLFFIFLAIFSLVLIILTSTIAQMSNASGLPKDLPGINNKNVKQPSYENQVGQQTCTFFDGNLLASNSQTDILLEGTFRPDDDNQYLLFSSIPLTTSLFNNLFLAIFLLILALSLMGIMLYKILQASRKAKVTESNLKVLLESNPSAIMIFQNFRIRFANSALEQLTGYSRDELTRMEVWQLIHPISLNDPAENNVIINDGAFQYRGEFCIITKTKELKWIDLSTRSTHFNEQHAVLATAIDITEKKNTEEQLKESELRYKNFFSDNSAIMLISDPETGKIIDANHAAVTYYGYSKSELTNLNLRDINVMSNEDIEKEMLKAKEDGRKYYFFRHQLSDQSERDVEVYTSKIKVKESLLNYSIIFDITQRSKMEKELKAAKEVAEEANRVKSFFVSNVSHEIRTPLNAIVGLTDLVLQSGVNLTEGQLKNMQSIKYSSDHLLGVINDVLDFSKLEAGKVEIEKIEFDVYQLVNESVKTVEFKANERGIVINTSIDSDTPAVLKGDPSRLRQILLNLLSNAIKFTNEGHVNVDLKLLNTTADQAELKFSVSDTGCGIPETKQKALFQNFIQADSNISREFGGTGLGLSISKKLVELQDGKIGFKSVEGMGSTFWFSIGYEISEKTHLPDMSKIGDRMKDLSGIKILLVEDDRMNQFVMKQIIEKWSAEMQIANNGKEAIQLLEKNRYDIILMDLHMPELNGYHTAKIIRNKHSDVLDHKTPILALTADVTNETKQKVAEAGMNDFINKPSEQQVIYEKITTALGNKKNKFVEKKTSEPQKVEKDTGQEYEHAKLRIKKALTDIFDDDLQGTLGLIERFLKEIPRAIVGINEAFYDKDYDAVGKLVHKVKPGYSYMGFNEVSEKITRIQELTKSRTKTHELESLCKELDEASREIINLLREVHKEYLKNDSVNIN